MKSFRSKRLGLLKPKRQFILWDLDTRKGKVYLSRQLALAAAKRRWKNARVEETGHYIYADSNSPYSHEGRELVASLFPTGPTEPGYF